MARHSSYWLYSAAIRFSVHGPSKKRLAAELTVTMQSLEFMKMSNRRIYSRGELHLMDLDHICECVAECANLFIGSAHLTMQVAVQPQAKASAIPWTREFNIYRGTKYEGTIAEELAPVWIKQ